MIHKSFMSCIGSWYCGRERMAQDVEYVQYVKGSGHDNWHWCKNCSQYPFFVYERRFEKPKSKLCPQCEAKEQNGECQLRESTGKGQNEPHIDKFV